MRKTCAVVMGLDVSGYGLVRCLAREGVPVVGLWRGGDESGRFSRYCTAIKVEPDDDATWIATLLDLAQQYDRPVLFPCSDRHADRLARFQDVLAPVTRFHWVSPEAIRRVMDKGRIGEVATRAGLLVPRSHRPQGPDAAAAAAGFTFPCVVKPIDALHARLPGNAKTVTCGNAAELVALYRDRPELFGTTVWQEIIEGEDDAIYQGTALALHPGETSAVSCVRKIRQFIPGFGVMSFGRTEWHEEVVGQTKRLVDALGWLGVASIEFKCRARDGRFYLIEMNPRVPWYNVLFADAGINLPFLSWCSLTGASLPPPERVRQREGVAWVSATADLASFRERHRRGTLTARAWLGSLRSARSFAWFERRDPRPALAAAARLPALTWRMLSRGKRARPSGASAAVGPLP